MDLLDEMFDDNAPLTEEEKKELQVPEPDKKPCPDCGKLLTWLVDGSRPRQHKCVEKPAPQANAVPDPMQDIEPAPPIQTSGVTVDLVVAKYVETRDLIAEKKKAYEAEVADLKVLQEKREAWLKGQLDASGVESMRTHHGTCFIDWKDSATVADRETFLEWVRVQEAWDFLENRVSKTAVKQRLDEGLEPPPGVNYVKLKGVKVRRA